MIRFEQYNWHYDNTSLPALDRLCLTIKSGEFLLLTGPSGAGKSTLGLALTGCLRSRHPGRSTGHIFLHETDITHAQPLDVAGSIALVQQNPDMNLACLTVEQELAFVLENQNVDPCEIQTRMDTITKALNIQALRTSQLSKLSEGQKQRVGVGAALMGNPQVLVLDEPTACLDPDGIADLLTLLTTLQQQKGLTLIIIEHRLEPFIPLHPRIVTLKRGAIVASTQMDSGHPQLDSTGLTNLRPSMRLQDASPVLEVKDLIVVRGSNCVLDHFSCSIHPGEIVALMGPNGSGKSSLLLALMGLIPSIQGRIDLLGTSVTGRNTYDIGRKTGFVFQNPDHQLFTDSVLEEAMFAGRNFACNTELLQTQALDWLNQAQLHHRVEVHPYRLSHGQKRRLNLIAVVLHDIKLLLLDEPFIGQDPENATWLMTTLRHLAQEGLGILVIVHDPRVVTSCCDRVVFLASGIKQVDAPIAQAWDQLVRLGFKHYVPRDWMQEHAV